MESAPRTDAQLIAEAVAPATQRAARERAYAELYGKHYATVAAICRRICRGDADADDAIQATFVAAFKYLDAYRGESAFSTWLGRIAMRSALKELSRGRAHAEAVEARTDDELEHQGHAQPHAENPANRIWLQQGLSRLPAEQQLLLSLFAVQGLAHEEIAEMLGIPVGTVWSRLHAARKAAAAAMRS